MWKVHLSTAVLKEEREGTCMLGTFVRDGAWRMRNSVPVVEQARSNSARVDWMAAGRADSSEPGAYGRNVLMWRE